MKLKVAEFNGEILVFVENESGEEWLVKNVTAFSLRRDGGGRVYTINVDAFCQFERVE